MFKLRSKEQSAKRMQKAIDRINSITPWFAKQQRFLEDDARFCFQMAASQSGKTEVAVPKFLRRILRNQKRLRKKHGRYIDASYWIVLPTYDIIAPVKKKMKKYLPKRSGLIDRAAQGQSEAFWSTKPGVGGIAFLEYGASISYKSFKQGEGLVAETSSGIWVDECARCDDVDVWGNLFARLKETKGWLIGTSSPAKRSGFYTEIYKQHLDDPEFSWLKWTSYDSANSKYSNITLKEVEEARKRMAPHLFAREYLAEWASSEGQIYPEFSYEQNVVKELPFCPSPTFIIGVDVGVAHPTAIEICRFSGDDFIFTEEQTLDSPTVGGIVKSLVQIYLRYKPECIYYDYGGGGAFLATEWSKYWAEAALGKYGVEQQLAAPKARRCLVKAWKKVNDGIQIMAAGFASNTIKVATGCKRLIDEVDDYVWSDHTSDDIPVKENDDHVDAARYAVATYVAQKLSSRKSKDIFGVAA